jgi:hypothetical protein
VNRPGSATAEVKVIATNAPTPGTVISGPVGNFVCERA